VWEHRIGFINIWTSLIRTSRPSYPCVHKLLCHL
jgi:hypothetical protein